MATQGTVTAFYCKKEDWSMYIERLNHYFIANDVAEGKKLILLSACGATIYMYRLIQSLLPHTERERKFYDFVGEIHSVTNCSMV